jgi:regulator of protease activity HflC (stomatin/prohibitin superfamily)
MTRDHKMDNDTKFYIKIVSSITTASTILIVAGMYGCPQYNVYTKRMEGEAMLAHSIASKEVQVRQAQAEMEAASLRAKAISIVGQASKDFPEYRKQEFIGAFAEALKDGKISQIIYIPTEAGIPITEAKSNAK